MPSASKSTRYGWMRLVDSSALAMRPAETPEWVTIGSGATERIIAAPWYEWSPENWQFKCMLCGSHGTWCTSNAHVESEGHTSKLAWRAKDFIPEYRRVDINEGFDYDDPWNLQYRLKIGKHAPAADGSQPPPPPPLEDSSGGAASSVQVPPAPPLVAPPPGMAGEQSAVMIAELREIKDAVLRLQRSVAALSLELHTFIGGQQAKDSMVSES